MTHRIPAILALLVLFLLPAAATAQTSTQIEVKDGKVYVNGEFVKELDSAQGGVYFLDNDADGTVGLVHGFGNTLRSLDRLRDTQWRLSNEAAMSFPDSESRFFGSLRSGMMDSHVMEMESKSRQLAMKYRQNPDDADATEAELESVLSDIFDRKLELQQERITELREELQSLETRLQERRDSRSVIIDRRLQDLLGRKDVLDW